MEWTADAVDLGQMRYQFAPLFDRAAHAVQRTGYEQDDAVIDRFLVCRFGTNGAWHVPASSLADRDRFLNPLIRAAHSFTDRRFTPADIRVVGLRVEAVLEQWE